MAKNSADNVRDENELVFAALGGLGEIGMNAYLYGFGPRDERQWLLVDLGLTFPGPSEPGVEVILPDLRFIIEDRKSLAGILITHGHEDHLGAVLELWPELEAPIYATPFTAGLLRAKQGEFGGKLKLPIEKVALGSRFNIGAFDIELIGMAHSIPEPNGIVIRTPAGNVFHTGDWKLDRDPYVGEPPDEERLSQLGKEGVHAMICDSTNVMREGASPSEADVAASLTDIIKAQPNRVIITTFASNVARVKAVADAAIVTGRRLVVSGRSLHRIINVAIDTGYLPKDFTYLDQDEYQHLNRRDVLLLCTGSQGEPRAALSRIADDDHHAIKVAKGDTVIFSSRNIPGNERAISRVQNNLAMQGCHVLTDNDGLVHVTGHPRRDELRQMYEWIKPAIAVPMHGEVRHLRAHAKLAREVGVKSAIFAVNGDMVLLAPGRPGIVDEVPCGRLFRDGKLIVPGVDGAVRERRKLSAVGVVSVSFVLSRDGELVCEPEAMIDGVPDETVDEHDMLDVVLDAVEGTISSIPKAKRRDPERVREAVRRSVRAAVGDEWGKRPIAKVLVHVVDTA
ncbi:MAG: ribonuclease J [Hyphomicrobiaceae bacterium]